ncbi:cytochrome P450 ClCP1 [Colletotrichum tamarilloi]|uniref:Cytochrome P450 ClCP1 n=1 Tax=Colletotrichum tamarilloi TaxID=1209934 RepID=A0ABQ9RLU9_9PEZI|nr:cytochrome P450 ClCP1 [Colletotrichum tamarilloi]KAK1507463.1 cytochrome P450 ClCP1 [Colletotrichum tamarilloi]
MAVLHSFLTAITACAAFIAVYTVSCIFYNLFLHPLRHYPGPISMRATRWAFCHRLIKGALPMDVLELHKKYGDVVRVAPDELAYCNVNAWKDIMGHRSAGSPTFEKAPKFYRPTAEQPINIVNTNGAEHAMLRRQLSHGFSERSLRDQQPLIMKYVDLMIQRLHEHCSGEEPVDLMSWYNFTTFDIIGDLAFGEPFGCLEKSEYYPWVKAIFQSARLGVFAQTAGHFPFLKKIIFTLLATKAAKKARGENLARAKAKLERRMELGKKEGGRPDLIEGLLKKKDELNISFETLAANSNTLIIGGSETTATLLAGVTYYLLTNRDCLAKLTDEVRSSFKTEEEIDLVSVNKLTYMLACLDEALRVYPPVSMGLPRVTPKGGATICGNFVPENTIVAIHQWAINHNEQYFKDPYGFHPERFMGDEKFASDNREAFQPFHIGSRNCLGRNLAYVEMRLILARLIWNFDIEIDEDYKDWAKKQQVFIFSSLMFSSTQRGVTNVKRLSSIRASPQSEHRRKSPGSASIESSQEVVMSASARTWRDSAYLVISGIQLTAMLLVDLVPFYPSALYAAPSSPLHFLQVLRDFYISTYNDPFFTASHENLPSWFKLFTYIEIVYQLPMAAWMVYRFSRNTGTTAGFELAVLVFCVECALTTLTCIYDVFHWDPAVYSQAQKNVFVFNLYGPWVVIPALMGLDMWLRILKRVNTVDSTKKLQ